MPRTLPDEVWDAYTVWPLPPGQAQLLIGLHPIHEVTTPQARQMLKELKLSVRIPERTFGTIDHIIPMPVRSLDAPLSRGMMRWGNSV